MCKPIWQMMISIEPVDINEYLKQKLTDAVRTFAANRPRSKQTAIGPSELGNPCDRALALKSLGYRGHGVSLPKDPWAAFIGTSVHAELEKVYVTENVINEPEGNWIVEQRVEIAPGITGMADLYDSETETVIDHKIVADTVYKKAVAGDISETYFVQVQSYGYGFEAAGFPVKHVAIAFWPRGTGAHLGGLHLALWPYDVNVVQQALTRWYSLVGAAIDLDLEHFPQRAQLLATADAPCSWCPFFDYTGRSAVQPSCKGHKVK